ncbi:MAG: hypothetical protein AB8G96_02065 [Phycisphaerales bacterium]
MKLTLTPGACGATDLAVLREHGFDDEAITVIVQVIGYFNCINRIADGLGVDAEPWMTIDREQWHREKATFSRPPAERAQARIDRPTKKRRGG